ncbi:transcriptional regulator GcvA [Caballeronia sp. 15715]|jgi:LysR family transcriptional regulator, glycine cleavage system transcriptional activator|uniref:transcriptional regulator GcvA n=1 Tax=unclassified Caballeronia TaxID=2646786 RepID=UPI0039E3AB0D
MKYPVHLNALRAFEASARHQSFSAAATELNVTSAAVGQLVRGLEEWLGAPLFHRSTSGTIRLAPTEIAQRALPDIRAGFDRLALGLERLQEASANGVLTVTTSPAFAAKWLLPRIDRFQQAHPETDLRLDTSLKLLDFAAHGIDIGVRYGAGKWPGLTAEKLFDEELYPVCSPDFRRKNGGLRSLSDLKGRTLIHDLSMETSAGFPTWRTWLETAGINDVASNRGLRINNSAAVVQAAIDGHGIALGRSVMVHDDMAAGRLVRLFSRKACPLQLAYYVVYRPEGAHLPRVSAFCKWLRAECLTVQQNTKK